MSVDFYYRLVFFIVVVLATDLILYFGLRRVIRRRKKNTSLKRFNLAFLAVIAVFALYALVHFLVLRYTGSDYTHYRQYFFITGVFLAIYLPKIVAALFIVTEQIIILSIVLISFARQNRKHYEFVKRIRRFRAISIFGLVIGIILFGYVLYGMFYTRTDYIVRHQSIRYAELPASFNGLKIVLISDMHLGSFFHPAEVRKGLDMVSAQQPDLILFAGDMINIEAEETLPYLDMMAKLRAPLGKFSVLGNHDMDDYLKFNKVDDPEKVTRTLVRNKRSMGIRVLRNEHQFVFRGNDSIALIGVDNWGMPPFRKHGDLAAAGSGIDFRTFKILLTHNPDHWKAEVAGKTNIHLSLAGHTHALQLGINAFGMKWSPISLKYPEWMGLYGKGSQYLYVSPGFGYLGFPGRIGIRPEITVITLLKE